MQHLRLSLRPGESIRSPRIMQLYWSGGDQYRAYNLFRRTMLAHVVPKCDGQTVTPPIVHLSTSFYELNGTTEANVLSHLEAIKGLGFEMFWLDAYWTRDGFPAGMGHYGFPIERVEPRDRFPRGIAADPRRRPPGRPEVPDVVRARARASRARRSPRNIRNG